MITDDGEKLKDRAIDVPEKIGRCLTLEPQEAQEFYRLLYKMLNAME